MQLKIVAISIILLFICSSLFVSASVIKNENYESNIDTQEILEGGWVEEVNGITILHVSGSYYEMGYQHGYLLKDEIKKSIWIFINYYDQAYGMSYDETLSIWNKTRNYVPESIIDEMQGMADGAGLSFEAIAVAQTIRMKYHCSVISASGPATSDRKLYFARSLDWSSVIKDPVTGEYLDNHVLFVRKPDEGYASMYPGYSGFAVTYGGINENGISIAVTGSWSSDETYYGLTERFRMKEVLDHAFTANEAIDIINQNKTCGLNFIISDSKTGDSFVVEQTANITYIGRWNSTVESNKPCWQINHVLRRTNFFINKTTAKTQRYCFDPRNPLSLIALIKPIHKYNFLCNIQQIYWMHYKAISKAVEKRWGAINLFDTMSMIRNVYNGKNNLLFKLNNFYWKHFQIGYYPSHQWVACPETGEMLVSFAHSEKRAFEQLVHYFNLFEFLEHEPIE